MSLETAARAVEHWALDVREIGLVAQRENAVYRVATEDDTHFALRLHRKGYQTDAALLSELHWMQHLKAAAIDVPEPIPTTTGTLLSWEDGFAVDLLSWLEGQPLGSISTPLDVADRNATFFAMGALMARVHAASDAWTPPDGFVRSAWDLDGLIGETPLWGRYWENPALTADQAELLIALRAIARRQLSTHTLDVGLIHADMVPENVLVAPHGLQLIDFDDSGYGYRLFDIATAALKYRAEPDIDTLTQSLINGYHSVRPLDVTLLPLFMLLRAQTYLGWIMQRINEPGAAARQDRLIAATFDMATAYQATYRDQTGELP